MGARLLVSEEFHLFAGFGAAQEGSSSGGDVHKGCHLAPCDSMQTSGNVAPLTVSKVARAGCRRPQDCHYIGVAPANSLLRLLTM